MTSPPENLDAALRAVAAGELDSLTPAQVAALEEALNREPRVAARLKSCAPVPDPLLAAALTRLTQHHAPTKIAWDRVWERVDEATTPVVARHQATPARVLFRFWKPLAVAAACAVLALTWRFGSPSADEWPLRLATSVEIVSLEVYDGATPFVIQSGGEHGVSVIWMLPDQG